MPIQPDSRAWVEVDLDALRHNYRTVESVIGPGVRTIVMVKADAYGLGASRVVRALEPLQPWAYGVATAAEGIALRRSGVERTVLVTTPIAPPAVREAARAGLTASISDLGQLERWAEAAEECPHGVDFQIEIDTGMGRCGLNWREAARWGKLVRELSGDRVRWTGAFTHFHSADSADGSAAVQWQRFQDALAELPPAGPDFMVHAANSAALLRFPEYHADAVRFGIFLYGGDPVPELRVTGTPDSELPPLTEPVATVRARILKVREVEPGSTVGYGSTYQARGVERWATLGIGYGDGWTRALSNQGSVLVRGRRAPIIGRISMDLTVVDVTGVPSAEVNDIVTLIGRADGAEIRVEEVAEQVGTISYEILTRLGQRLPRIEVGEIG